MKKLIVLFTIAILSNLVNCQETDTTVNVDSAQVDPRGRLVVISFGDNFESRTAFEREMSLSFIENGIPATPSVNYIPLGTEWNSINKDSLKQVFNDEGIRGAFVLRVISLDKKVVHTANALIGTDPKNREYGALDLYLATINFRKHEITSEVKKINLEWNLTLGEISETNTLTIKNKKNKQKMIENLVKTISKQLKKTKLYDYL